MKISGLLFRLGLGFVPLIVYVVAEAIWGTLVGVAVGVGTGIVEFVVVLLRQKRVDWFVLLDVGLLVVLGLLSIGSEEGLFFRLKPALLDLILVGLLVFSLVGTRNLVLGMMIRNLDDASREKFEKASDRIRPMLWGLTIILAVHALATGAAALWADEATWIFVSGPLLFAMCGVWFVFEIVRLRLSMRIKTFPGKAQPGEEMLPVIDEKGNIVGKAPRSVCHRAPGLLHPVVRLIVIDNEGFVLLQKRSPKKQSWPGSWDSSASGHIAFGEKPETTVAREALEEIGLDVDPKTMRFTFTARYATEDHSYYAGPGQVDKEMSFLFTIKIDATERKKLRPDEAEVSELKWVRAEDAAAVLGPDAIVCPNLLKDLGLMKHQIPHRPLTATPRGE